MKQIYITIAIAIAALGCCSCSETGKKSAEVEVTKKVESFQERFSILTDELQKELANPTQNQDQVITRYILKTYALHEEAFRYALEKRLPVDLEDEYIKVSKLLTDISSTQLKYDQQRKNYISGLGLAELFVIETRHDVQLTQIYSVESCKTVLKIDPNNRDALNTIESILNSDNWLKDEQPNGETKFTLKY